MESGGARGDHGSAKWPRSSFGRGQSYRPGLDGRLDGGPTGSALEKARR